MTTFLLIRHAATDAIGQRLVSRSPLVRLNALGERQIEQLATRLALLPIAAIYSSPLERTVASAEAIAQPLGLSVSIEDALNEFEFGAWTGKTFDELNELSDWHDFNRFRSGTRAPGGESMLDVQQRMVGALENLRGRHPSQMVAIVSHGDPLRALLAYYMGIPLDLFQRIEIAPASVSVLELDGEAARVRRLNDTYEIP